MSHWPVHYEEMLIAECQEELQYYSRVFHERVAAAFTNLEEEAKDVQRNVYERMASCTSYGEDDSQISEAAYHKGVEFYLATDAIRQGVFNLMVAGLFHLFEQQCAKLCRPHSQFAVQSPGRYPLNDLKGALQKRGIDICKFRSWELLAELNLLANVVKHGDGESETKLRTRNPDLFKTRSDQYSLGLESLSNKQLRPLVGEGMELNEAHFTTYTNALTTFWEELRNILTESSQNNQAPS